MRTRFGYYPLLIFFLTWGCNTSTEYDKLLSSEASSDQKRELINVLEHYRERSSDSLKYKAALFLISNIEGKKSYDSQVSSNVAQLADSMDSLWSNRVLKYPVDGQAVSTALAALGAREQLAGQIQKSDVELVSSRFLIENIDDAFLAWKLYPWSKKVPFAVFCEYILPYKVFAEPIRRGWRKKIMNDFRWLTDSLGQTERIKDVVNIVGKHLASRVSYSASMNFFPEVFGYEDLNKTRVGKCEHLVTYNTQVLRALGIPVMVDFTPAWGNNSSGHTWNSVKLENGKLYTFDALYPNPGQNEAERGMIPEAVLRTRLTPKIYRHSFSRHSDVPETVQAAFPREFGNCFVQDVTREYNHRYGNLAFPAIPGVHDKRIYLCVYNTDSWKIAAFSDSLNNGYYKFRDLGFGIVYLPVRVNGADLVPVRPPFFLSAGGKPLFFNETDKNRQQMVLKRKAPIDYDLTKALTALVGSRFEYSEDKKNPKYKTLCTIVNMPAPNMNRIYLKGNQSVESIRFLSPDTVCRIAEMRFYGIRQRGAKRVKEERITGEYIFAPYKPNNGPSNVADSNILSYYISDTKKNGYIGLDMQGSVKYRLTRIEFFPPNDGNSVETGDLYELFYWNREWKSLGRQVATAEQLVFENCPVNCVYKLRNLTKGYKERIFGYTKGKQIWF